MIRSIFLYFALFTVISIQAQDKLEYLESNRHDLRATNFLFPETDFNILGFGALHGSSKTYETELGLIKALKRQGLFEYYIIETNYSQAYYFQNYLNSGDEDLLKELTFGFQTIVAQEGTVETFNHWKNLRALHLKHPDKPIKVLGCDVVNEYRFPMKHILELTTNDTAWSQREKLKKALEQDRKDFSIWNKDLNEIIKSFIDDYRTYRTKYVSLVLDVEIFEHILKNIYHNFEDQRVREKIIFDNYVMFQKKLGLADKKQFVKYGYFHIQKYREGNHPSFFTRLIEQKVYSREKVITVMGYLTKSKVLWDKVYDKEGNYKSYTTKSGFGISDYWREYFKGIKKLKNQKLSDQTMFRLNKKNSPYGKDTDLVELKMIFKDYNTTKLEGKNTLQFIDYAILISDSKEQIPLEELDERVK